MNLLLDLAPRVGMNQEDVLYAALVERLSDCPNCPARKGERCRPFLHIEAGWPCRDRHGAAGADVRSVRPPFEVSRMRREARRRPQKPVLAIPRPPAQRRLFR